MSCEFCPRAGGGCGVCALVETPQGVRPRVSPPRPVERVPAVTCDECGRPCTNWNAYGGGVTVLCLECDRPELSIHEGE